MKRVMAMMAVLFLTVMACFPALASDRTAAASQLQITADHAFWQNNEETLSGYGAGSFTLNLNNGYSVLQGYVGSRITADKLNIYLLGVTTNDPFGWSAGPSAWLEYAGEKHYLFYEYDYNCPFMSTVNEEDPALMGEDPPLPLHSYFTYAEYRYQLKDNVGVGFAFESAGNYETVKAQELAYGPFYQMGKLRLWAFYDVTPMIDGFEIWGLRFLIKL